MEEDILEKLIGGLAVALMLNPSSPSFLSKNPSPRADTLLGVQNVMSTAVTVIAGALVGGLLYLLLRVTRPRPAFSPQPEAPSTLPALGATVPGDFTRHGELIHTICKVEEKKDSSVLLRVMTEMGRVPLVGLRAETEGQLEVGTRLIPFQVTQVNFPWIEVTAFPERARPVQRQFLRIPASFAVRYRPQGMTDPWIGGTGIDLSSGGLSFTSPSLTPPALGLVYEVEIILALRQREQKKLLLEAVVRWVTTTSDAIIVGLQVSDPAQQKELVNTVARLQHQMARHPDDYLLAEPAKPQLR